MHRARRLLIVPRSSKKFLRMRSSRTLACRPRWRWRLPKKPGNTDKQRTPQEVCNLSVRIVFDITTDLIPLTSRSKCTRGNSCQSHQQRNRSRVLRQGREIHKIRRLPRSSCRRRIRRTARRHNRQADRRFGRRRCVNCNWPTRRRNRFSLRRHEWTFLGSR